MIHIPILWHTTLVEAVWTLVCFLGAYYASGGVREAKRDRVEADGVNLASALLARISLRTERLLFWVPAVFTITGLLASIFPGPTVVTYSGLVLVGSLVLGVCAFPAVSYLNRRDRPRLNRELLEL